MIDPARLYTITNAIGHRCAQYRAEDRGTKYSGLTLGAYRRGRAMPSCPGAVIAVWRPCARPVLGVEWPHCYWMTVCGDVASLGDSELSQHAGSIYCPSCRAEMAVPVAIQVARTIPAHPSPLQLTRKSDSDSLPF